MKLMNDNWITHNRMSILAIIGYILLIPTLAIFQGLLFMCLWSWFIVPLGVVSITLPHAIGLGILASLFRTGIQDKDYVKFAMQNATYIAVLFFLAYVIHFFI